jgi:HK97 family phage prohead protease
MDNLVRAFIDPEAVHLRADDGVDDSAGRTLYGRFAVFNRWTEINSFYEGNFLERIAPGAAERTINEHRDRVKVLYDHGFDPMLGNKPLGPIRELREDAKGVYYEVPLIDASYNDEFILPAARAGLLGASFRFRVTGEEWVEPRDVSKYNPKKLKERTITDFDLYEFGPVTFPAYAEASAGVRATTDSFVGRMLADPAGLARFIDRTDARAATKFLESLPPSARGSDPVQPPSAPDTPDDDDSALGETPRSPTTAAERQQVARRNALAARRRARNES